MINIFTFSLTIFVVLVLNFENSALESGVHEILDSRLGLSLRKERIDARVCEDESVDEDEEWDLCYKSGLLSSSSEQNFIFENAISKQTYCMCDNECGLYRDCCVDSMSEDLYRDWIQEIRTDLSCIQLFSGSNALTAVYGVDRCGSDWTETKQLISTKEKCELDAQGFKLMGKQYSYLQDIPVFSESSNKMFKNIFCAVCNRDSSELKSWNISVECDGFQIDDKLRNQKNNMRSENYDPLVKKWKVFISNNESIKCSLAVNEFKDKEFYKENGLRICNKAINECPRSWTNTNVSNKCESYASYVYENNKSYKNYHCALCNGVNMRLVSCLPNETTIVGFRDWSKSTLWFPLLLDFNFAGNKGEWIGGERKCPNSGQLYDPLYEKCISIDCSERSTEDNENGGECLVNDIQENSFDSICSSFVILEDKTDFVILQNNSIYINQTKQLLNENYFEVFSEENIIKVKICRNKSELIYDSIIQSPFDINFGQILLSEISLYTSIFCLTIHLMVYILLPKLRNLPGKNLMSLSGSLLLGHISFAIGSHLKADRKLFCVLTAITTHYSYLAAFFWMSIMAFDVCKTFRRTSSRRSKTSKRYKFLKYSLYAWLSPAFIVLLSASFDIGLKESEFQPLYGYRVCWISQRQALLVFFAIPVAIIVSINIFLFTLTAKGLIKTEEQTKILNKKSDKIRYILYIKLAIIMGLTWIFGFVASLSDVKILWYPFIIFNGLQGTIIFIAFTCKRKVWNLLIEKFGLKKGYKHSATNSDVIRSATGSTSLQSSTLVPNSPNTNVTKIQFPK